MSRPAIVSTLLRGPLAEAGRLPLTLTALLCGLRPRFLPKGRAGRGYRAVSRNGRVLLASDVPVDEVAGRPAAVRLQVWHKAILPGEVPQPYGLLLCVRALAAVEAPPGYLTRLAPRSDEDCDKLPDLCLDVGGGLELHFYSPNP